VTNAFVRLQKVLPQHGLSRLIGKLAGSEQTWIAQPFIRVFSRAYNVDLNEAGRKFASDYRSFNDFFTRELMPGARPLPADTHALISPADGTLSQFGSIDAGQLLQAKGKLYSAESLLGSATLANRLEGGWFATVYLAPANYHRVHTPFAGRLVRTTAIPGALFSVNARTEAGLEALFCRNERLVCEFETPFGPAALVMVGAMIVASIETTWDGPKSPYRQRTDDACTIEFDRGAELGRFLLGSTAILAVPNGAFAAAPDLVPGQKITMGQLLATATPATPGRKEK
jgi:phosphatidylserine decarboxylase